MDYARMNGAIAQLNELALVAVNDPDGRGLVIAQEPARRILRALMEEAVAEERKRCLKLVHWWSHNEATVREMTPRPESLYTVIHDGLTVAELEERIR